MLIRPVIDADLPAVLEIHNEAILNTTANWSYDIDDLPSRVALLKERNASGNAFIGAFDADVLLGYATYGKFRERAGFSRTVEHSVYVHVNHHRKGVGKTLMIALIEAARVQGKHVMIGGLDAANEGSIVLHKKLGFVETARLPEVGHKFGRVLDFVFMQKIL